MKGLKPLPVSKLFAVSLAAALGCLVILRLCAPPHTVPARPLHQAPAIITSPVLNQARMQHAVVQADAFLAAKDNSASGISTIPTLSVDAQTLEDLAPTPTAIVETSADGPDLTVVATSTTATEQSETSAAQETTAVRESLIHCPAEAASKAIPSAKQFPGILVVVHFNFPHYESIPALRYAYSQYFDAIVFSGPAPHEDVVHCERGANGGAFGYVCLADILARLPEFGSSLEGILLVHDDVMIFPRQFPADFFQDPGTIMMTKWRKTCHRGQANAWGHCDKDWGFPAFDSALEALRHKGDERLTALADACGLFNTSKPMEAGYVDILYLPARPDIVWTYRELAEIFGAAGVFLEIAVLYMMDMIAELPGTTYRQLNGLVLWGDKRKQPADELVKTVLDSDRLVYLHPLKLGKNLYNEREAFCQYFSRVDEA